MIASELAFFQVRLQAKVSELITVKTFFLKFKQHN